MHHFLGLSIEEWGIMTGMAGTLVGAIIYLFRRLVVTPLINSIDHVAVELKDFRHDTEDNQAVFDDRLDNHERRITFLEAINKRPK